MAAARIVVAVAVISAIATSVAAGQRPAVGVVGTVVASDPVFVGAGPSARWVIGRHVGLAASLQAGSRGGRFVGRGEATVQMRLPPVGRPVTAGPTWYLAGGLAAVSRGEPEAALVAAIGVEIPSGRRGATWVVEAGVGGGARLVTGFRLPVGRRQ